jgi:hypothetical protein
MYSTSAPPHRPACYRSVRRTAPTLPAALALVLASAGSGIVSEVGAQISTGDLPSDQGPPPAVFLDCQGGPHCNFDHFRTEIRFVNWVREREDSDVHVIFTSTGTSAGGRMYELEFVGREAYADLRDRLTFTSRGEDVQAEVMDGLARTLRLGLMRFAVEAGSGHAFDLLYDGAAAEAGDEATGHGRGDPGAAGYYDPWDFWTFRFQLSGNMDFRETRTSTRVNPRVSADRVTEGWKLNFHTRLDLRRERRELSDGREVRDDRDDWRFTALIVRSVSDHVSVGVDTDLRNSVSRNQHARFRMNPAVEYNYHPYVEATRRQLIAHYSVGMEYSNYMDETIYGVTSETLPLHRLGVQYRAREEWGNAGIGVDAFQYLHHGRLYSFGVSGDLSYRLFRGLELNVSGSASRVNDNIHTPAVDIPDEEILLGRRNLPSSYRYQASVGFSYRWGSSFANVVNNRFPGSVR